MGGADVGGADVGVEDVDGGRVDGVVAGAGLPREVFWDAWPPHEASPARSRTAASATSTAGNVRFGGRVR